MRQALHLIILYVVVMVTVLAGVTACTDSKPQRSRVPQPSDTLYTAGRAMAIYDYQPERALRIIDSAVIVGNVSEVWADVSRARIYSNSFMGARLDSLLGGEGLRFDTARAIGERLLEHDSIRANLGMQQNVLEILVYSARQQQDMTRWLQWSQQLVDVCHRQGEAAEPEALRTEAEIGAALCHIGREDEGMARIDSVLAVLDSEEHRQFNWLDATIIALKRKLGVLNDEGKIVQTIPLARRIINRLDDYERHPEVFHDGTYREPTNPVCRADYIAFYRSQAQSFITAAYAKLGEQDSMNDVYNLIEHSVREATAREHIARYHALEQQMQLQDEKRHAQMMTIIAMASVISLLFILTFATYVYFQSRKIRQKNQVLIRQINQSLSDEAASSAEAPAKASSSDTNDTAVLFRTIDQCIRSERLYANANIGRQDICDRFNIRREVLNQLLTNYANGQSFPCYINGIRLAEACRLLKNEPSKTVVAIADEVGLSPRYLRRLFVEQYGVTPTEYRIGLDEG